MISKRRGGRIPRQRQEGERVPLGLRVSVDVKKRLDEAVIKSGRSQSAEAEYRLETSFERVEIIGRLRRIERLLRKFHSGS